MFTTGSKFLIGSAVLATVAAIAYGVTQDGVMGTIGLVSAAVALSFLAGVNLFTRDSNVWADEVESVETVAAAARPASNSIWPMGFAVGAVVLTVGLVTYQAVFIIGLVLMLAAGAEWTAQSWADRASADTGYNAEVRNRIANPLEFPLGAAIGIGLVIYAFSRIMLWLSKTNTVIAFAVAGIVILTLAFVFVSRPNAKPRVVAAILGIGVVGIVAGGAAAGVDGEREIEEHETTTGLEEEGVEICTSPEKFEADEKASQSVGVNSSAAVAATITLTGSGELQYDLNGPLEDGASAITLPRSNPNNIIFVNRSSDDRRLSVSLGTTEDEETGEEVPLHACTALVEEDGRQNITLVIGPPSMAFDDGYFFFVPGVESARLDLVVP